jgi:hypothetical protein
MFRDETRTSQLGWTALHDIPISLVAVTIHVLLNTHDPIMQLQTIEIVIMGIVGHLRSNAGVPAHDWR